MTDTVFVPKTLTRSDRRYHTDPDCQHVRETSRKWTLERARRYDLTECRLCAGDVDRSAQSWSTYRAIREHLEADHDE